MAALTGTEILYVNALDSTGAPSAILEQTTTSAIAALSSGGSTNTKITVLSTIGAGTITAAGIYGKITNRTGTQVAAFTDTTDTATALLALLPASAQVIGQSYVYRYENNTAFPVTITGGAGVTVSGVTTLPANSWAEWLLTFTAIATPTVTLVGFEQGYFPHVGTYVNNGATPVTVVDANVTAGSIISFTLKTVGGTVSASAPNIKTITPGTGFTVAGLASDTSTYNYEIRG